MARAMGSIWVRNGHEVTVSSWDVAEAASAGAEIRGSAISVDQIGELSEVVVLATTWSGARDALITLGDVPGQIVWSIVNPVKTDYSGLEIGTTTSGSEELSKLVPRSSFVASWPPFADAL